MEGELSFAETCSIISESASLIVGRTGNATLATMLPINIPILVILAHIERKWDYDYYNNLHIIRNDAMCKCTDEDINTCIKQYEDTWRTMCIGELKAEDIIKIIKNNIK